MLNLEYFICTVCPSRFTSPSPLKFSSTFLHHHLFSSSQFKWLANSKNGSKLKKRDLPCPYPQIAPPSLLSIRKKNYKAKIYEQDTEERDDKPRDLRREAPRYCDTWAAGKRELMAGAGSLGKHNFTPVWKSSYSPTWISEEVLCNCLHIVAFGWWARRINLRS